MSLPVAWSWAHVYLVGLAGPPAKALLDSVSANFNRTITLSKVDGVPPFLSLLVEVSQSPPSGVLTTVRSRPQVPLKNARGVSVEFAPVIFMTHRREPRTAAM